MQKLAPQIEKAGLEYDTVAKRKKDLGEALDNLYRFLNLVGFISLLLGAVGVASAIQAHLQQKVRTAAVLRCLGAAGRTTVAVYLLQAIALGIDRRARRRGARPNDCTELAPGHAAKISSRSRSRRRSRGRRSCAGWRLGLAVCILFALPPLLRFRRVSPLLTLRAAADENAAPGRRDLVSLVRLPRDRGRA